MGSEDVELVTVTKSVKKKSLLERYDIPIEHLSYEYVTTCTRVKELERIVLILRSGEEGIYPDLTRHAEERLALVKPQSAILRVAEPVLTKDMLPPERRRLLEKDINEWMTEMKLREKDLEEGRATLINEPDSQPGIRQIKFNEPKKKQRSSDGQEKRKRIGACDYVGWEKYDADTEINRIDLQLERKRAEAKRNQQKLRDKEEKMRKESTEAVFNKQSLTGTELMVMAEKQREKGNEAFRAGDYEEALQFYNSSIAIDGTMDAYNNRAITYVKLQRYGDAVNDCNRVIGVDRTNIKALLRRGLASEHLEKRAQALADYEAVLKVEPTNRVAIAALNKLREPCDTKKIRIKIEEASGESKSGEEKSVGNFRSGGTSRDSATSSEGNSVADGPRGFLNGIWVESTSPKTSPQVCFCGNAPSSSQHLSPLPHIRDAYCSETTQRNTRLPKSQSIFTDTKKSGEKSSVVIEEIPNERYEELEEKLKSHECRYTPTKLRGSNAILANFGAGDGGETTKKSAVINEEIPNEPSGEAKGTLKSESTENETEKLGAGNASDFGTGDNGKIGNTTAGLTVNGLPKNKDGPKLELTDDGRFERIESPYEFLKLWHSLKNDPELILHGRLLKALAPDDICKGNKLDGDMLSTILRCFERHFSTPGDTTLLYNFLHSLASVKRFSIVRMFIDGNDKKVLQAIFSALEAQGSSDGIRNLREAYDVPM